MLDKNEKRTFKLETARLRNTRLVAVRDKPDRERQPSGDQARELVIKLIEAIRKM